MHRDQNFGKVARLGRDICWQATHSLDAAPTSVLATARRTLNEAVAGLLCRFATRHLFGAAEAVASQEIHLPAHHHWSGLVEANTTILCREGTLWVTCTGDPHDHILRVGQALRIERRVQVVVTTFADAGALGLHATPRQ